MYCKNSTRATGIFRRLALPSISFHFDYRVKNIQLIRKNCFTMCPVEIEKKTKTKEKNELINKLLKLLNRLKSPVLNSPFEMKREIKLQQKGKSMEFVVD